MRPDFAIIAERKREDHTLIVIDQKKATIKGVPMEKMGLEGRRKLENLLILTRPKERLKFFYQM